MIVLDCVYGTLDSQPLHFVKAGPNKAWQKSTFLSKELKGLPRSSMMLEALCWDPTTTKKTPVSVCAVPIQHAYEGIGAEARGKVAMVETIGAGGSLAVIDFHSIIL